MTSLDKCVERIFRHMCIEVRNVINTVISSGRYWFKWVDKVWDENCEHSINLNFSFEFTDVNQNTFIIWDIHFKNETRKVTYHDDISPECKCGMFVSSKVSHHN